MHPILRVALTTLCVIALSWPLLFWGKPALPEHRERYLDAGQPTINGNMARHELLW